MSLLTAACTWYTGEMLLSFTKALLGSLSGKKQQNYVEAKGTTEILLH